MTAPYSEDFVDEYIGKNIIEEYKNTDFYTSTRQSFENEEKKNQAVFDIVKHQYIDSKRFDDIFLQFHLLSVQDRIAALMVYICSKAVKVYSCDGLLMYFTDRQTNRTKHSWSVWTFEILKIQRI